MATAKIVGLTSGPIWGVPDTDYGAGMSFDEEHGGEVTEMKNGNSQIIAASFHSDKNTMSYTAKIKGALPSWTRGMEVTIDGQTGYLANWSKGKKEGDFAEVKLEFSQYPDFS